MKYREFLDIGEAVRALLDTPMKMSLGLKLAKATKAVREEWNLFNSMKDDIGRKYGVVDPRGGVRISDPQKIDAYMAELDEALEQEFEMPPMELPLNDEILALDIRGNFSALLEPYFKENA
jgi:hypothetical protein